MKVTVKYGDNQFEVDEVGLTVEQLDQLLKVFFEHLPSSGNSSTLEQILTAIQEIKEQNKMELVELQTLNDLTNTLATTVEEVVAQDQAEDAEFLRQIDDLKAQLVAAGALNAQTQATLDAMTAGVGEVNPRLQAVIDALKATGSNPAQPLPPPDIPPAEPNP